MRQLRLSATFFRNFAYGYAVVGGLSALLYTALYGIAVTDGWWVVAVLVASAPLALLFGALWGNRLSAPQVWYSVLLKSTLLAASAVGWYTFAIPPAFVLLGSVLVDVLAGSVPLPAQKWSLNFLRTLLSASVATMLAYGGYLVYLSGFLAIQPAGLTSGSVVHMQATTLSWALVAACVAVHVLVASGRGRRWWAFYFPAVIGSLIMWPWLAARFGLVAFEPWAWLYVAGATTLYGLAEWLGAHQGKHKRHHVLRLHHHGKRSLHDHPHFKK